MNVYEKRNAMLAVEFDRYVRDHPSFAARIPCGAQIVLQIPVETDDQDQAAVYLQGEPVVSDVDVRK
jgi:hypothetical protein